MTHRNIFLSNGFGRPSPKSNPRFRIKFADRMIFLNKASSNAERRLIRDCVQVQEPAAWEAMGEIALENLLNLSPKVIPLLVR